MMPVDVPLGTPDYSRGSPFSDQIIVNTPAGVGNNEVQLAQVYLGNIRAIWFDAEMTGDSGQLVLAWFADPAFTIQLGEHDIDLIDGLDLQHTCRPFTPYLQITMGSHLGGAFDYKFIATSMPETPLPLSTSGSTELISQTQIAIGAASSQLFPASRMVIGKALWNGYASVATWRASLLRTDRGGSTSIIDQVDNTCVKGMMRPAWVTAGKLSIRIDNTSAAAGICSAYMLTDVNE